MVYQSRNYNIFSGKIYEIIKNNHLLSAEKNYVELLPLIRCV